MSAIVLRRRNGEVKAHVLVSDEDFAWLSEHNWSLDGKGYARRWLTIDGVRSTVGMHREILGLHRGDARECDHINGNPLDNRRANLRIVTRQQNNQNVRHRVGRSGHRNVYWHRASGLWHVQIKKQGRWISGGYFKDLDAAVEKARALRKIHMPFAVEEAA